MIIITTTVDQATQCHKCKYQDSGTLRARHSLGYFADVKQWYEMSAAH